MPIKVGFLSLGCPKNQVDSEIMMGLLQKAGFELTPDEKAAEVIVVNTCSFIDDAKEESVNALLRISSLKKEGRCRLLVATGCLPQRYGKEMLTEMPEVDAVVGTGDFSRIVEICRERIGTGPVLSHVEGPVLRLGSGQAYAVSSPEHADYEKIYHRLRISSPHSAYIKISEGCDHSCTFCIIPTLRGKQRSRSIGSIVSEVEILAREGVKEINLIGQDLTSYGRDLREREGLSRLLRRLVTVKGIEWIRLLYTYPGAFTSELVSVMAGEEKICRYIDMPIQHIDDAILRRMRRGTTRAKIEGTVSTLREKIPGVILRTSLIVGFPGETERRYQELVDFVRQASFDRLGVFTYSREEGTAAGVFPDRISQGEKIRRRENLMEVQQEVSHRKNLALIGTQQRVLVDGPSEDWPEEFSGRTFAHAPEIDGGVLLRGAKVSPGDFVDVEITEAHPYDLAGKILSEERLTSSLG